MTTDQFNRPPWQPQQTYAQPPSSPKKPIYKRVWFWLAIGLVLISLLAFGAALGTADSINRDIGTTEVKDGNALADVKSVVGSTNELGWLQATVTVVNSTKEAHDYAVVVSFENVKGEQVATGTAFFQSVAPGQKASEQAVTGVEKKAGTKITVRAAEASRL